MRRLPWRSSAGLVRTRSNTIGNFWVDLVRTCTRVLLPLSFVVALVLVSQGAIQNFHSPQSVHTVTGQTQTIAQGPIASQEAIKEVGENGGGPLNANSAHPYENPNGITNVLEIWLLLAIPFSFPFTFGKLVGDMRQGWVVLAAMFVLWFASAALVMTFETQGSPKIASAHVTQSTTSANSGGGNMEGKETRFGSAGCGVFAASTTGTSTGSVDCAHDSLTPLGGGTALVNIMFGEVDPGGTGSGLYGMLVFALTERVHCGPDGRAHAGVSGQEDPGRRDEARRALHPRGAAGDPRVRRHLDRAEDRDVVTRQPRPARAHRDDVRVHECVEQQRLRVRRAQRRTRSGSTPPWASACSSAATC